MNYDDWKCMDPAVAEQQYQDRRDSQDPAEDEGDWGACDNCCEWVWVDGIPMNCCCHCRNDTYCEEHNDRRTDTE